MANEINAKITADASSYNRSIKEITQESKTLASELKKVKSSFDENTTAQEKGAKIAEVVSKQVKNQEDYIAKLKEEYQKLTEKEGDNTIALSRQQELINKAETALNGMNAELKDAQNMADGYGEEAKDAAEQTDVMDEAARTLAASKLAEFYEKVSEAAQKVASAAYDAAKELDDGYDTIIKKTGATGDALKGLQDSADNVFGNMPSDMADVGTAIGEVNTRFGLTGDELENVSELFLKFAEITDSDVNSAIGTTSRLLKTYGGDVKDANKLLGYFAKQSQDTGVDTTKLLNALDQSGATLRGMGLDLQQSTKLLALFEQNGVDSAGAMAGLRKAVINGAKDGKSFAEVMADASEQIKNAATDTEALEIATELFGTKGAVVMADGIRDGRISLDDLSESMEQYGTVVSDTFEETLDPWDKAKVAMNNLKTAGSELAGEALEAIAPILDKVVDLVKDGVKWFKNLPGPVKKVVSVVGLLGVGAGVAVPKVMSLFNTLSMFKAANAVKAMTSVSDATNGVASSSTKASSALSVLTNPVTLGVAAVSALGLALAGLGKHMEDQIQAEYGLTEAQKEQIKAAEEIRIAYEEMAAARNEAVQSVQAEYDYIENLAREYDTLIDAGGKVKQGYEDRANFILNELAKATDQTVEDIQREIDENGKLKQSIYDTINAKRAEATLSAYESSYAEAKQKQAQAQKDYAAAVATATERQREYEKVISGSAGVYLKQRDALEQQAAGLDKNSQAYTDLMMQISALDEQYTTERAALATVTDAWEQAKQAVTDADTAMVGINSTITNYEGLSSAIISGDVDKINTALHNLTTNLIQAKEGTKESLEAQYKAAEENLSNMEAAFKAGKVDQAAVTMARTLVRDAKRELDDFKNIGKDISKGLVDGMTADQGKAYTQARNLGRKAVQEVAKGAETSSASKATKRTGGDVGEGLVRGMKAKEGAVKTGGTNLGKAATGGVSEGAPASEFNKIGQNAAQQIAAGMDANKQKAYDAGARVANSQRSGVKWSDDTLIGWGRNFDSQIASGMTANMQTNYDAAAKVAYKQRDGVKWSDGTLTGWGKNFTKNIAIGMIDPKELKAVTDASTIIAEKMASRVKHSVPKIGPLSTELEWGPHMVDNIVKGMTSPASIRALEEASSVMAKAMVTPTLTFGADGINGKAVSNSLTYGDIIVNVDGAGVQNEELLARKISDRIFRQVQSERMAYS